MAAFKAHCAVNFWRHVELPGLAGNDAAMGQLGRITSLDDLAGIDELILAAAALAPTAKPKAARKTPKPEKLHPDFAAALDKAPAVRANYEAMPPSHRRDYCDWINEAKRDATRATRIDKALAMIAEGKDRNWKYRDC